MIVPNHACSDRDDIQQAELPQALNRVEEPIHTLGVVPDAVSALAEEIDAATQQATLLALARRCLMLQRSAGEGFGPRIAALRARALMRAGQARQALRIALPLLDSDSFDVEGVDMVWAALIGAAVRCREHTLVGGLLGRLGERVERGAVAEPPAFALMEAHAAALEFVFAPEQEVARAKRRLLEAAVQCGRTDEAAVLCADLVERARNAGLWKEASDLQRTHVALVEQRCAELLVVHPGEPSAARQTDLVSSMMETLGRRQEALATREAETEHERDVMARELARMSHEIRTPLHGLHGAIELLEGTTLTVEQHELTEAARASAELALGVINSVLDVSKLDAGQVTVERALVDIGDLVRDVLLVVRNRAEAKALTLHGRIRSGAPVRIMTDPVRLRQVLLNLVGNAVKFTDRGSVQVEVTGSDAQVRFTVRDSGIGIPRDALSKVFDRYVQVHPERGGGTGLGLSITREIVRLLQGRISVTSALDVGTTFGVVMPTLVPDSPTVTETIELLRPRAPSPRAPVKPLDLRVLVAEDNLLNQRVVMRMLESVGCSVVLVADGQQAVDRALAEEFDVVLMDCNMPRMNGWQAASHLRKMRYSGRIIAFTADAMEDARHRCMAAGMDAVLTKPARLADIRKALSQESG